MLANLNIKNLALVESLNIEFGEGLNVITGETGAGKSVILGAIKLLLGGRADKSMIRTNARQAELTAVIELGHTPALQQLSEKILQDAGIPSEDNGQIILRRIIGNNSNRNFINSTPTTLQTMKALGTCFIDVYAPGEQQGLADNTKQRTLLDRYAGLQEQCMKVGSVYSKLQKLLLELENFHKDIPDRGEVEILQYQLNEITEADIKKNEDHDIQLEYKQCAGARELAQDSMEINSLLCDSENSVLSQLQQSIRLLDSMNSIDSKGSENFSNRVSSLIEDINEISRDISDYAEQLNLDPEHLNFLEERLSILQQIKRKFGPEIQDVFAYRDKLTKKINKAEQSESIQQKLSQSIDSAQKKLGNACQKLSTARKKATEKLARSISEQLKDLGFNASEFSIEISECKATSSGHDHVEFCFAPNAGEGSNPIKEIASSGEISRVMLAIKTVLAKIDQVPILIFDEIDANIGGIVATQIAQKLIELGKQHQIFCITHMPQVAAGGNTHFRVEKNSIEGRTFTGMRLLSSNERVEEIARMLGGSSISSVVHSHAKELLLSGKN